jgi:hypothetical protein
MEPTFPFWGSIGTKNRPSSLGRRIYQKQNPPSTALIVYHVTGVTERLPSRIRPFLVGELPRTPYTGSLRFPRTLLLGSSPGNQIAFVAPVDTYVTRLLAQALSHVPAKAFLLLGR